MKNCFKWVFKKKGPIFLAILLIFLFNSAVCLPTLSEQTASSIPQGQGIYVDEEITAPITQIGIPEEYWEPQVEENGLEIAWNQWHANVRNQLFRSIKNRDWPQGYSIWIIYTVDLNKNISNIVFMYYPEQAILNKNNVGYLKQNTDFYLYLYDSNKFYKLSLTNEPILLSSDEFDKILQNSVQTQINFKQFPYWAAFLSLGQKIKGFSGNECLTFPEKTKRTTVIVRQGLTDIDWLKSGNYEAAMFNDIEKQ